MSNDWQWFRVPMTVYDRLPEVGRAVTVYLVLARHANEDGECWPCQKRIAEAAGVSDRAVRKYLATLESVGLVVRRRRRRDTEVFTLPHFVCDSKSGTSVPVKDTESGTHVPVKEVKTGTKRRLDRNKSTVKSGTPVPTEEEPRTIPLKKRARFVVPSVDEVATYCLERKNNVDPQAFIDHYTSNGWKVGRNQMKDWRAAVRTWERNGFSSNSNSKPQNREPLKELQ